MLLAEWRVWWAERGERELRDLLAARWDPFEDEAFRTEADAELPRLARSLHEGANQVDVQIFLNDLRRRHWPRRHGQKWFNRDRAVSRHVLVWYEEATGELRP